MSNKRIQKKRAKAELQRDKSKVIASIIVLLDSEHSRYEQIKTAKRLRKMSMEELFALSERAIRVSVSYHSPLRPMIPRDAPVVDWSSAVGYRPTISDVRERER